MDADEKIVYSPIYYFRANGKEYKCETKTSSSILPKENKSKVYYDSKKPEDCMTQYGKSTSTIAGIVCLIAALIIAILTKIKTPIVTNKSQKKKKLDTKEQYQMKENIKKVNAIIGKVQLVYKRIILGIIIVILFLVILFDTIIIKQTIIAKDYIETTATLLEKKSDGENNVFDEYIYTFKDKQGKEQEITISISQNDIAEDKIKIKYDKNNPQEYYTDGSTYDMSGIIWYVVKIVITVLLIILFFNKKLLNKIDIFTKRRE